jgi:transcriptional regulator with XRE-family HTH domain
MILDNKKIGQRILSLRKHSNMTQMELSEIVGASHQAVSKWENGECLPDIEVLLRLAKAFNLSVEGILLHDTKVSMYRGFVVTYSDATYYCEYSVNKKVTSIQEATVFPNLDKRWMTPKDIKIPAFFFA